MEWVFFAIFAAAVLVIVGVWNHYDLGRRS